MSSRAVAPAPSPELPPVESLTFDADFTPFLKPGVDPALRRAALRTLLRDPRFNVMDGLDVYIDDYTKSQPLDAGLIKDLVQARYVLSPPATRVNAEGYVEDLPEDEARQDATAAPAGEERDLSLEPPAPVAPPAVPSVSAVPIVSTEAAPPASHEAMDETGVAPGARSAGEARVSRDEETP